MIKDIVFREHISESYLMWGVLVFAFFFVLYLLFKAIKLLRDRRAVVELAAKDGMGRTVLVSLWFNVLWYAAVVVLCSYLLWVTWQDTFNGFTRAEISSTDVVVFYMWPREYKSISRLDVGTVNLKKWGRNGAVLQIITRDGAKLRSVSGNWNDMQGKQGSFIRALN